MAYYLIQDSTLAGIADAIRGKTGGADPIPVPDMSALIAGISQGGGLPTCVAEIAGGTFSVAEATEGAADMSSTNAILAEHGMSGVPDGWIVVPTTWYDTQDSQCICASYFRYRAASVFGRRSVASNRTWTRNTPLFAEHDGGESGFGDATYVNIRSGAFAKLLPTWIDEEGNTGTQIYRWIAWRWA